MAGGSEPDAGRWTTDPGRGLHFLDAESADPGGASSRFWDDHDCDGLAAHAAVKSYGKGTSSQDLASFIECLASRASSRVRGIGAEQYGQGALQKYEVHTNAETLEELLDELADAVAYISFIAIRVSAAAA